MRVDELEVGHYYTQNNHYYKITDNDEVLHVSDMTINIIPKSVLSIIIKAGTEIIEVSQEDFNDKCKNVIFELGIYELVKTK